MSAGDSIWVTYKGGHNSGGVQQYTMQDVNGKWMWVSKKSKSSASSAALRPWQVSSDQHGRTHALYYAAGLQHWRLSTFSHAKEQSQGCCATSAVVPNAVPWYTDDVAAADCTTSTVVLGSNKVHYGGLACADVRSANEGATVAVKDTQSTAWLHRQPGQSVESFCHGNPFLCYNHANHDASKEIEASSKAMEGAICPTAASWSHDGEDLVATVTCDRPKYPAVTEQQYYQQCCASDVNHNSVWVVDQDADAVWNLPLSAKEYYNQQQYNADDATNKKAKSKLKVFKDLEAAVAQAQATVDKADAAFVEADQWKSGNQVSCAQEPTYPGCDTRKAALGDARRELTKATEQADNNAKTEYETLTMQAAKKVAEAVDAATEYVLTEVTMPSTKSRWMWVSDTNAIDYAKDKQHWRMSTLANARSFADTAFPTGTPPRATSTSGERTGCPTAADWSNSKTDSIARVTCLKPVKVAALCCGNSNELVVTDPNDIKSIYRKHTSSFNGQPYWTKSKDRAAPPADGECYLQASGEDYRGKVAETKSGYTCLSWAQKVKSDRGDGYWKGSPAAANAGVGDHNYCRNPHADHSHWNQAHGQRLPEANAAKPWCYTTNPTQRWEECEVGPASKGKGFHVKNKLSSEYVGRVAGMSDDTFCRAHAHTVPSLCYFNGDSDCSGHTHAHALYYAAPSQNWHLSPLTHLHNLEQGHASDVNNEDSAVIESASLQEEGTACPTRAAWPTANANGYTVTCPAPVTPTVPAQQVCCSSGHMWVEGQNRVERYTFQDNHINGKPYWLSDKNSKGHQAGAGPRLPHKHVLYHSTTGKRGSDTSATNFWHLSSENDALQLNGGASSPNNEGWGPEGDTSSCPATTGNSTTWVRSDQVTGAVVKRNWWTISCEEPLPKKYANAPNFWVTCPTGNPTQYVQSAGTHNDRPFWTSAASATNSHLHGHVLYYAANRKRWHIASATHFSNIQANPALEQHDDHDGHVEWRSVANEAMPKGWVLSKMHAYCDGGFHTASDTNKAVIMPQHAFSERTAMCKQAVLDDVDCSNTMFAYQDRCFCVRKGQKCVEMSSPISSHVYRYVPNPTNPAYWPMNADWASTGCSFQANRPQAPVACCSGSNEVWVTDFFGKSVEYTKRALNVNGRNMYEDRSMGADGHVHGHALYFAPGKKHWHVSSLMHAERVEQGLISDDEHEHEDDAFNLASRDPMYVY